MPVFCTFAKMKRYTAIFFLSIYLMSFTECHQFVRIPFMVEHFRQHKAIDPSMDFVKFIQIHYFSANIVTDDFLQDQQLPFRSVRVPYAKYNGIYPGKPAIRISCTRQHCKKSTHHTMKSTNHSFQSSIFSSLHVVPEYNF